MAAKSSVLSFEGCNFFRQRLVLATLSGNSVKIKKIRFKDNNPGLRDFEASFIRLLDQLTNGSIIEVNETGTVVYYQPGLLIGGTLEHNCNQQRSIGYYLEALIILAPFCKLPLNINLTGVTNSREDPSVDLIKLSTLPLLKKFLGTDEGLEFKVTRRGVPPGGGGQVVFRCPCRQKLRTLQLTDQGKVKRIRGVAWAVRTSPAVCNRIVDSARSILNKFLPDIYIYTDHLKGNQSGKSPGFGLTLVGETTSGVFLGAEVCSNPKGGEDGPSVPEDLGREAASRLMEEIYRGGCVDSTTQSMAVTLLAMGDKDVCKLMTGPLSPYTIQMLRHLRDFFQVMFKMDVVAAAGSENEEEEEDEEHAGGSKVMLTTVGVGYRNLSKVTS